MTTTLDSPPRERVEKSGTTDLQKIVAAKKIPGMPATTESVAGLVSAGVRYIYTHLPRLIGAGSAAFLKAGRG